MTKALLSAQVILADAGDPGAVASCQRAFADLGFVVHPAFAGSFAIEGPAARFRSALGAHPTADAPELALDRLPPALRRLVRAITGTRPPDFGPGNP